MGPQLDPFCEFRLKYKGILVVGWMDLFRGERPPTLTPPFAIDPQGKKILLIHTYPSLGPAVLLAPVVHALVKAGVRPPVGLLVRPEAARIWKHIDLPVRIHGLDDRLVSVGRSSEGMIGSETDAERLRLAVKLRRSQYHIAADVSPRSLVDVRYWMEQSGAPLRLGFLAEEEQSAPDLTWGVPAPEEPQEEHWVHHISTALRPLGLGRLTDKMSFSCTEAARTKAEHLWGASPRVLIVPGFRSPQYRLPVRCFAAAGQWSTRRGGSVVVAGAPDEHQELKALTHEIGLGANIYKGKTLAPLVGLIQSADVVLSRDTGPIHVAFLAGAKTVGLFAAHSPLSWGPMQPRSRYALVNIPPETAEAASPVIERLILQHLERHLTNGREEGGVPS